MDRYLIAGAEGQLGQYLVGALQKSESPENIICLTRFGCIPNSPVVDANHPNTLFYKIDEVDDVLKQFSPTIFINCAAQSSVAESIKNPDDCIIVNYNIVANQLAGIRKYSPLTKYYNCGSIDELGATISPYAFSKKETRRLIEFYRQKYNIWATQSYLCNFESILRPESFVSRKITKGLSRIFAGLDTEPITLGNITGGRFWLDVSDVVESIFQTIKMEYIVGGMIDYVVSPEEKYSVNCFFEEAVKCFGKVGLWDNGGYMVDGQVVAKIDMDLFRPAQSYTLSSTYNYLINSGFWKPQISFQQLVKTMVEYDRNHLAEG